MAQCAYCGKAMNDSTGKCTVCGKTAAGKGNILREVNSGLKEVNSDLEKMFEEMLPVGEKLEASCKKRLAEIMPKERLDPFLKQIKGVIINMVRPIDLILSGTNNRSTQSCPWCDYKFGLLTFSLQFRVAFGFGALRLSDAPQKFFPCPKCNKSIKRETNREATKLAARRVAWLFLIPLGGWFFTSYVCHASTVTTTVVVILLTLFCLELFGTITDYKGQILKKAE